MSWNTTLTVVEAAAGRPDPADVAVDGPASCETEPRGVRVEVDGDVVITGDLDVTETVVPSYVATGARVVTVILGGVADVYELRVFEDRAMVRNIVRVEGDTVVDTGEPLPGEHKAESEQFAEDRFLALWEIAGGPAIGSWYFEPVGRRVGAGGSDGAGTPLPPEKKPKRRRWFGRG